MTDEEKKAIKIINDYIERKRATRTVFNTEDIIFDNIIILLGLLEKQTELEERNKKDYISKDKIREKIKEYQEKAEDVKQKYKGVYAYKDDYLEALAKIEGYQELLEEK